MLENICIKTVAKYEFYTLLCHGLIVSNMRDHSCISVEERML